MIKKRGGFEKTRLEGVGTGLIEHSNPGQGLPKAKVRNSCLAMGASVISLRGVRCLALGKQR